MAATVLIVDDLEANLKELEARLVAEYYSVITESSPIKALDFLLSEKHKVDLVLLDVMMPEMNGFDLCKLIKSNKKTMHIPVIMITASEMSSKVKGLEAGADEFLSKPVDKIALSVRVKSLTRMKKALDELIVRNQTAAKLGGKLEDLEVTLDEIKVLILDDDLVQGNNIRDKLSSLGANVQILPFLQTSSGGFIGGTPDVVIVSTHLFTTDPLKILGELRVQSVFGTTIVIFIADEHNMEVVNFGMELGVSDYFIYPVDSSELQARVRTQLRRKVYQEKLRKELAETVDLSTKDGLTGMFNRHYFDVHIDQLSKNLPTTCVVMMDIDYFKDVNDVHGHAVGDEVLKQISNILRVAFRVTDIVSRYGGEEFVALLIDISIEDCFILAERLRNNIEHMKFKISNRKSLQQTISIGIAELREGESIQDCVIRSDNALYKAKEQGRNKIILSR